MSYDEIKRKLWAAESAESLAESDRLVREAVSLGATGHDIDTNLTAAKRKALRAWARKQERSRSES